MDKAQPLVSIIIPTYNRLFLLKEALKSAQNQKYALTEIIVVDDGSTDGTKEHLEQFQGGEVITQAHKGSASARNYGVKEAKGKYIAFLDTDDQWLPEKLEQQVQYLEEHAEDAFVFSASDLIDAQGEIIGQHILKPNEKTTFACLFEKDRNITFSVSLIRKTFLDHIGEIDELLSQASDYDLWLRLAKKYSYGYLDEVLTRRRVYTHNMHEYLEESVKAHVHIFKKTAVLGNKLPHWVRVRTASIYFYVGDQYYEKKYFRKGAYWYYRSVLILPTIGVHHWHYLYRNDAKFKADLKRMFKLTFRIIRGFLAGNKAKEGTLCY